MDSVIEDVRLRKIIDSRGNPTVEADVLTWNGFGRAAAPSGASTGINEVASFPEGGVDQVINEVEDLISSEIIGMEAEDLREIDNVLKEIDGTDNFSTIGGNTAVAVSMATAKAGASSYNLPLYKFLGGIMPTSIPFPLGNMINGGAHAGKNAPDIQEFLVIPVGASNITEAITTNIKVHRKIKSKIQEKDDTFTGGKGDEGGWAPNLTNEEALEIQTSSCEEVSDETGVLVRPGLDVASSEFWNEEEQKYVYEREGVSRSIEEQIDYIADLVDTYKFFYVEDPIQENDFEAFAELTKKSGKDCLICGDDLFVTNAKILAEGIKANAGNSLIIKPNQIGTLTDTYNTIQLAKSNNYVPVVSHRSGETTDETIAHLAVAFQAPVIKTGAAGGERIAKLNELVRIEEELSNPQMAEL
ncbi:phosphopyruvate hydratase [Methanosphaera sp. BMS]|uniref:phosphopyruvate hydratase n=1 Tax=Methanosphaera sp. BMS TaxID=1789762 RepID=UPI000DC1CD9A|nr:phosphopyruvate hydratase [Methanosphaera sp. BMS]AWX31895.1 enolase [Methanosphaera sp. BMS]MBR3214532.1 phosphopyruvate hydratase [Methanosphaera sp.]